MLDSLIYDAIAKHIECKYLDVSGDGHHFEAIIVSDVFIDKSLLERHRVVYHALGDLMRETVHALSMKVYTLAEWKKING